MSSTEDHEGWPLFQLASDNSPPGSKVLGCQQCHAVLILGDPDPWLEEQFRTLHFHHEGVRL